MLDFDADSSRCS